MVITGLIGLALSGALANADFDGQTWLCSGQSNMAYTLDRGRDAGFELPADMATRLARVDLRFATLPVMTSLEPLAPHENPLHWRPVTPETMGESSAVCLFAALDYAEATGQSVRYIVSALGGSHIEPWLPARELADWFAAHPDWDAYMRDPEGALAAWQAEIEPVILAEDPLSALRAADPDYWPDTSAWPVIAGPQRWENTQIGARDGVVWLAHRFDLNARDLTGPADLALATIDDVDWTYVNGCAVGANFIWSVDRHYTVDPACLREGENEVLIRVYDGGGSGGLKSQAHQLYIQTQAGRRIALAGDWAYHLGAEPGLPSSPSGSAQTIPTGLYNGMIAPLLDQPIDAVIWYQGEGNRNASTQGEYAQYLKALMRSWRSDFDAPDLPFVIVQLPEFDAQGDGQGYRFGKIRLAQFLAANSDPYAFLISGLGEGVLTDIHPWDKTQIAARIAEALQGLSDHPALLLLSREGARVSLSCDGALSLEPGLVADQGRPAFELCQDSEVCTPIDVSLEGGQIYLPSGDALRGALTYARADLPAQKLMCAGRPLPAFQLHIPG
ncbi:sialate O-acetylesterase [Woodsholea maritima]|uniref:sialate O-acetylesterase n=1 Tax=Woodsholea maritima TaxID=240237 RepID=UPI00035E5495|nr:sialate O-acetylesterase [Woodsholea maritima]